MTPIVSGRLILRNWEDRDRELFHLINSDERVMEFYPFRLSRAEADNLLDKWRRELDDTGLGLFAIELAESGACMGYCGVKHPNVMPHLPKETIEIGWRLAPSFWGRGYVTEAAAQMLRYGFETIGLPEIVSFAVGANRRSTAVMQRLGMRRDEESDFDHPRVPETHPHLKRHVVYRLAAEDWRRGRTAG
ncbi:MAG: GNAT family N-acetyltransferase [Rhizobiaceae bacterium]|nr:GNAT family N-acetyltransferase [Rhizobiaceae bacterium]